MTPLYVEVHVTGMPKEALDEYIGETREMCERVSLNLGRVEKNLHDDETLNSIYRDMHSIKGSSHLFGFKHIGELAHVMETALDPVRHKSVSVGSELVDAMYAGLDLISKMMENIINSGDEGPESAAALARVIPRIADLTIAALGADLSVNNDRAGALDIVVSSDRVAPAESKRDRSAPVITPRVASMNSQPVRQSLAQQSSQPVIQESIPQDPRPVARTEEVREKKDVTSRDDHAADTGSIRIHVGLLDNLMNLVGELVLIRNQVLQFSDRNVSHDFQKLSQRLNVVTSELQNDVMKTRMQPVGAVMTKFHRVVRDMSRDLGKRIELKLDGVDTELDKTLIEAVKDPLTHLIRNCIDHGIEVPDERKRAGKAEIGRITIRSYHEGGQVIIEVADDGRGLARDKIGKKALEKNLVTADQLARMSEREVQSLIFAPGFTTAEKVSDISGRGVGMDVVKTNIERIGGTIELESTRGLGALVRLKIPLTLAIIPALVVRAGAERFAIPQVKVVELVRLENDRKSANGLESLQGRPVYRLRGDLIPLVGLTTLVGLEPDRPEELIKRPSHNIVILQSDSGMFGLVVDEIVDSADIVVKPVAQNLKLLRAYSGATIMGDGSVVLILDVSGLAGLASIALNVTEQRRAKKPVSSSKVLSDVAEYLVMDLGVPGHYAIPLCLVNRLEEFSLRDIEMAGEQRVVKYRDTLLPLIPLAKRLSLHGAEQIAPRADERISVIVISKMNRLFGFEVKGIVDVLQIDTNIDCDLSDRAGILGSVISGRQVVTILDALGIVDDAIKLMSRGAAAHSGAVVPIERNLGSSQPAKKRPEARDSRAGLKILLAEDTAFFRRQVKSFLESRGYEVVAVVNGEEAFKKLEVSGPHEFALVLTDIEMPLMDGFELARRIRARTELAQMPVVALTTRFRKSDVQKGAEVGFNAYLEKFNADVLIENMDRIFGVSEAS